MALPNIIFNDDDITNHLDKKSDIELKIDKLLKKTRDTNQKKYLKLFKKELEKLLTGDLKELLKLKNEFISIIDLSHTQCKIKKKPKCKCSVCKDNENKSSFSKKIQNILDYSHEKMIKYFLSNGIKTCYICNAQYATVSQKDYLKSHKRNYKKILFKKNSEFERQEKNKAKFQLDHLFAKSIFPIFSISLHNLYPICSSCNLSKGNKYIKIENIFTHIKYELDIDSILAYLTKKESLQLNLTDNTSTVAKDKLSKIFDLKGIYDNHLDEIEELIERKIKYQNSYKEVLVHRFGSITISSKNIDNRLMLGTYDKNEGFYKRPLSKFIHDINDQLDQL